MEDIQKISRRKPKVETALTDSLLPTTDKGNIALYLGASAFFVSVASAFFLYREISNVKKSLGDVKQLKNQLSNMDSRFEDMDEQLKKVLNIVSKQSKSVVPHQIRTKPSFKIPQNQPQMHINVPQTKVPVNVNLSHELISDSIDVQSVSSEEIEGDSESDNDSEISYESDSIEE